MALQVDTWSAEVAQLEADGWVILEYSRYDPTHATGITPTGKALRVDVVRTGVGDTVLCTMVIAGIVQVRTAILLVDWEPGDAMAQLIRATYLQFKPKER